MKLVKYISAILLGVIFLISSSGFLIYTSHCVCTGNETVSLFVSQEICNPGSDETEPSCCAEKEENECQNSDSDCDKPEAKYFKLKNNVVHQELNFIKIVPFEMLVTTTIIQFILWDKEEASETSYQYIDLPPTITSSLDFLIQIRQLKIPLLA